MDLDEWEFLPDDGFIDFHEDGVKKKIFHRDPKSIFNMNHFICPSSPRKIIDPPPLSPSKSKPKNSIVPIRFDPQIGQIGKKDDDGDDELVKEIITKVPIEICILPSAISEKIRAPNLGAMVEDGSEADQDAVSQVFFKKMKENEFVDMKMDSPKSGNRGIMHQVDAGSFQFDDNNNNNNNNNSKGEVMEKKNNNSMDSEMKEGEVMNWEENSEGGLNIWRWSLTGIGTICSVGVAAATICILIFGNQQRDKQNHKLQFQIYTDDKKIKQVVHHATKLNEAISAVRGVPLTRAHITIGGYYDGL